MKLILAASLAARTMTPTQQQESRVDDDWIICCGQTRDVVDGLVACPRARGHSVPVGDCAACRFLAWHHDERDADPPCTIGN